MIYVIKNNITGEYCVRPDLYVWTKKIEKAWIFRRKFTNPYPWWWNLEEGPHPYEVKPIEIKEL